MWSSPERRHVTDIRVANTVLLLTQNTFYSTATMNHKQSNYKQGHSASTVSNHAIRTVDTDASFVLPHIKPTDRILDMGCGPGSITVGFTRYATQGSVVGVDISETVLDIARQHADSPSTASVSFVAADVLVGLPFANNEFDIVFASQLFPHLQGDKTLRALQEMRRVLKPGGILATRDAAEIHWYPVRLGLDRTMTGRMLRGIGSESWPGGRLPAILRKVSFDVDADASGPQVVGQRSRIGLGTTVHFGAEARARFADGFLGRLEEGDAYRKAWSDAGITDSEVEESKAALVGWKATEDAWYLGIHTEILAWK